MRNIISEFENYVKKNPLTIKSCHPYFEKALNEMILAGGKRFRTELLLVVIVSLKPELAKKAFPIGLAIEMMHTYSLIHDDLPSLDNADLRRGHPTLHKTYDEVTAILVGDGLNTHSFNLLANSNFDDSTKIKLIKEFSDNTGISGMVIGQAIDCYFENKNLDIDEIILMHKNKTGKCIAGPLKMGAIICKCDNEFQNNIYELGLKVGLLFQIQDDIFDITKTEQEALKSVNIDENKNTFVTLLGLEGAMKKAEKLVCEIEENLEKFDGILKENLDQLFERYIYRHRI